MFNMEKEEEIIFFSKLPIDMRNEIFSYLNPLDIFCNVFNVCKNWRFQLCNFYLRNNCKKFIEFYNIENIEEFIINLVNDKKLFLKFKKYLFNQQVSQLSCELQKLQIIDKNNIYLINKNNITIILKDLYNYYSLINENKHYLSKKRNDNNYSTVDNISSSVTSCFGSDLKLNNTNNHNNNTNIDTSLNTLLPNYLKNDNNLIRFKSIFIGDYNIGKTCFLKATSSKTFDNNIGGAFRTKEHLFYNIYLKFKMELWDTAEQEKFIKKPYQKLASIYFRNSNIIFLCFDLTNKASFENLKNYWLKEIDNHLNTVLLKEIILIGLKSDDLKEEELILRNNEAEKLAFELNAIYFEVSSKEMENVDEPTWFAVLKMFCNNEFVKRIAVNRMNE